MSRHGYSGECDSQEAQWASIRYGGALKKAIEGKRGQAFLRELLTALDALPEKRLIEGELVTPQGEVCALGSVMAARGVDVSNIPVDCWEAVAKSLGITETLAREIMYWNDEAGTYHRDHTGEDRFRSVRAWVVRQIKETVQ